MFERRTGVESRPYLPSHPPIAGQRHTGTGFQILLFSMQRHTADDRVTPNDLRHRAPQT